MSNKRRNDLFFFSSRRRHTRLQGDWSSDVCSSDLPAPRRSHGPTRPHRTRPARPAPPAACAPAARARRPRSEERRVGIKGKEKDEDLTSRDSRQEYDLAESGLKIRLQKIAVMEY